MWLYKKAKKFINCLACLLIALVFAFSLLACNNEISNNSTESGSNKIPNDNEQGEIDNPCRNPTVEELYNPKHTSFAKMKIIEVFDDMYCSLIDKSEHYIVIECLVEDDFYGKLSAGTTVFIPVILNKGKNAYLDEIATKNLFSEGDIIFAYFWEANESELISCQSNDKLSFSYLASSCGLFPFDIILISDNKVDLNLICTFLDNQEVSYLSYKSFYGFTDYIDNGMTVDELSENLKYLANKVK